VLSTSQTGVGFAHTPHTLTGASIWTLASVEALPDPSESTQTGGDFDVSQTSLPGHDRSAAHGTFCSKLA
jgi:hypothetical protein